MGMFDTVLFKCPKCGDVIDEQTKVGDCNLNDYESNFVPINIAHCLEGNLVTCGNCAVSFTMHQLTRTDTVPMYLKEVL